MKQYKSLDLAKFIGAILIIVLHTAPFSSYSKVITFGLRNIATIIAVPLFFVISGFFAFKKYEVLDKAERKGYLLHYLKRLLVMYLFWSAVYFGFVVVKWVRGGFTVFCVLEYIRDFFFEGSYSTIWFLPALLSAVALVALLRKGFDYRQIFALSCFLYLFTLGGSSYYGLVTKLPFFEKVYDVYYTVFDTIKNGVCFGLIFVSMGGWIATKAETAPKGKTVVGVIVCGCLLAVEALALAVMDWNAKGVDTIIMVVPLSYFVMKLLLSWEPNIAGKTCVTMRKISTLLFVCQRLPMSVIDLFLEHSVWKQNSLLYFAAVFSVTILISFAILKASERIRILKNVY